MVVSSDLSETAKSFSATIDWGDGTTSAGTITFLDTELGTLRYNVAGTHTYAEVGTYVDHITIVDQDGETQTLTGQAAVAPETIDMGPPDELWLARGMSEKYAVAYFDDSAEDAYGDQSFTATIDWGDGTTSAGEVGRVAYPQSMIVGQAPRRQYALGVFGEHTYAVDGDYTIHVALVGPGSATASTTDTAHVTDTGQPNRPPNPSPDPVAPGAPITSPAPTSPSNPVATPASAPPMTPAPSTSVIGLNHASIFHVPAASTAMPQHGHRPLQRHVRPSGHDGAAKPAKASLHEAPAISRLPAAEKHTAVGRPHPHRTLPR
jgi:hypothetical protein